MSRSAGFFVAIEAERWYVARVTGEEPEVCELPFDRREGLAAAAAKVASVLGEWGYRGQGIRMGLSSDMIFNALVDSDGLPRKQRHRAMIYRLEEQLPLDAERLTVDFLAVNGSRMLGAAVETDRVKAVIDALSAAGVEVAGVCATALLALWRVRPDGGYGDDYGVVASASHADAFRLNGDRPVAWYSAPRESPAELVNAVKADQLLSPDESGRPTACVVGELAPEAAGELQEQVGLELRPASPEA
ncbi:hypothetical protein LCGC14_2818000, partial [marine sediment metagenome]